VYNRIPYKHFSMSAIVFARGRMRALQIRSR
jgi:hypothetical protein